MSTDTKVYIFGASGSGTTTLASELSKRLNVPHFDADDFYWIKTNPPYTTKRDIDQRANLLTKTLEGHPNWVISGSMLKWGDIVHQSSTLNVYMYVPQEIRLKRIHDRENHRYGARILFGGDMFSIHQEFLDWAKKYDDPDFEGRSYKKHVEFIKTLTAPTIEIKGDYSLEQSLSLVLKEISKKD